MAEEMSALVMERNAARRWDYSVVTIHARHNDTLEDALKAKGQDGWELAFVTMPIQNEYQCVFRRTV